jgi:hypothetical protein
MDGRLSGAGVEAQPASHAAKTIVIRMQGHDPLGERPLISSGALLW